MIRAALVAGALVLGAGAWAGMPGTAARPAPHPIPVEQVVVGSVYDGDTFTLADQRKVRVLVMDACEARDPAGPRATADARRLLQGRVVTLSGEPQADRDYFGRLLRYVEVDGRDFAEAMLAEDHTAVYQGRSDASRERLVAGRAADLDGRDCTHP